MPDLSRSLLTLLLLAPLGLGCAPEAELRAAMPLAGTAPEEPAGPAAADHAAEAKLAQLYSNALADQLNVEREHRRRDLAELKRRVQTEKRIAEARQRQDEKARREQETKARKAPPTPKLQERALAVIPPPPRSSATATSSEELPVFEPATTIVLPQALRSAKRNPAPVLFDPEARKGG